MPHVHHEVRSLYEDALDTLPEILEKGDLTYLIVRLQLKFSDCPGTVKNYERLSAAVAAARDAAHQYEIRVLDPYEEKAAARNGDVFAIYGGSARL